MKPMSIFLISFCAIFALFLVWQSADYKRALEICMKTHSEDTCRYSLR